MTESGETDEVGKQLRNLASILDNPEQRILPLLYGSTDEAKAQRKKAQQELVTIAKSLFGEIENVAKQYRQVTNELKGKSTGEEDEANMETLSGLDELYAPDRGDDDEIDAEMLWGQVELQTQAALKLAKKSTKKLQKDPEKVVVLDMSQISSDEDSDSDSENDDDDDDSDDDSEGENDKDSAKNYDDDDEEEADSDRDVDEETRRIRARMERAMDDMDSDMDDDDDDDDGEDDGDGDEEDEVDTKPKATAKTEEPLYDPVAEEMKDGFFDLNEMEDFADEEEDFLPEEIYDTPQESEKKENKNKKQEKSFHQKQRDGDLLQNSDNDDDDDSDFEELYEEMEPVKRKKYREDDEIDALHTLYDTPKSDDDDDDDIINMTAADLFGKPNKKLMARYKEKAVKVPDGDDDSWGEYDFEKEDQKGWRNEDENASNDEKGSDDEESSSDEEEEDAENDDGEEEEEATGKAKASKKEDNSRHGKQAEKLRLQTEELEKELLAEKPWHMTGETKSTSRPVNSLLESTPEFEMASKQAPTITVEHTANLEEVIKKRILAEDWDDVVPRELPDVGWHKKRGELPEVSQEKSKLGLGELYEREYLKKAVGYDADAEEKKTAEEKAQDEMKALFANLCSKLDALSNYHFAPRPLADEAEVRPVTAPAIAMEEVLPLHVSDSRGVAPEEVYATKRGRDGVLKGESEMDQTERKRLRSAKKATRRKARKEKLADEKLISRLEPGLGLNNPYEKRKMREELALARSRGRVTDGERDMDAKFGSSGTFFKRLQSEAQKSIQDQAEGASQSQKKDSSKKSSAYKL